MYPSVPISRSYSSEQWMTNDIYLTSPHLRGKLYKNLSFLSYYTIHINDIIEVCLGNKMAPILILPLTSYGYLRSSWPIIFGQADHKLVVSIKMSTLLLYVANQNWPFHLKLLKWKKNWWRIRNNAFINV